MMKRMVLATLLTMVCFSNSLTAMDALRNRIVDLSIGLGHYIEKIDNVPVIDKLTNLLPVAIAVTALKEYPGQTMMALTGLFAYVLSRNESICATFKNYKARVFAQFKRNPQYPLELDETLFIFDGEDEDDAQDQEEMEDELLFQANDDIKLTKDSAHVKNPIQQHVIEFV